MDVYVLSFLSCISANLLDVSIYLPGKALVGMAEVEAAIQEMFQAPHMQVSQIVTLPYFDNGM